MALSYVADVLSVIGFVATLAGFAFTLYQVHRSRSAAERAEAAARAATSNLLRLESMSEISSALGVIDDIKRLHREGDWTRLPERYAVVRKHLIAVRSGNSALTDEQRATLQSAIAQFSTMETHIEEHLRKARRKVPDLTDPNGARLNRLTSKQSDGLAGLLAEIRTTSGEHVE